MSDSAPIASTPTPVAPAEPTTAAQPTQPAEPVAEDGPVPFYKTVKRSFRDVSLEPGVNTAQFCEATDAIVDFFDLFNNKAFQVVQNDISTKNARVRECLAKYPETSTTLEEILSTERTASNMGGEKFCTGQLTWLLRGLRFISLGLRTNMQKPQEELSTSLQGAYDKSLRPFHGMLIRPLFKLAMNVCPYRVKFYASLGEPKDVVWEELDQWLAGLEKILLQMARVYKKEGYGDIGMNNVV